MYLNICEQHNRHTITDNKIYDLNGLGADRGAQNVLLKLTQQTQIYACIEHRSMDRGLAAGPKMQYSTVLYHAVTIKMFCFQRDSCMKFMFARILCHTVWLPLRNTTRFSEQTDSMRRGFTAQIKSATER